MLLLIAGLCGAAAAGAQHVRGRVAESESGTPLNGAFVVLIDSSGVQRSGTLSDQRGDFVLRAPSAGRYRLRVELIGHESLLSRWLEVPASGPVVMDVTLAVAAIELEAVMAEGDRRCTVRPEAGEQAARLWEEVRKALTVTSWTEQQRIIEFRTRVFERELSLPALSMVWEGVRSGFTQVRPYTAVSPDSLAVYGFVRTVTPDSVLYYGPDAEVLISDAFLDAHCFQARRGKNDAEGLIGLAFEPARRSKLPDISGTLWLEPATGELKYIEYGYTGVDPDLNVPGVGGRTYFRRLPNGAWIVDRWYIRLPIPRRTFDGTLAAAALLEAGGEIVDVKIAGTAMPKSHISGIVYDSIGQAPLGRALVYLSGTAHSAVADSLGRFEITDVSSGVYTVAFSHPVLDSLPAMPVPRRITIEAPEDASVELAVPHMETLLRRACPAADSATIVFGQLQPGWDATIGEEIVLATYRSGNRWHEQKATPDASGRYVLCGLPSSAMIALTFPGTEPRRVRLRGERFLRIDQALP
ncbi:MAG: carboxypeptidase regulatory-like domain-containing protein [Gemmatimonadota bacterium]